MTVGVRERHDPEGHARPAVVPAPVDRVLMLVDGVRQPRTYTFQSESSIGRDYVDMGLIKRIEDAYPAPGGAPPTPPLPDIQLIEVPGGGALRYGAVAIVAAAIGAAAMWMIG